MFASHDTYRFAVVQVWFTGGRHRDYFISYRQQHYHGTGDRRPAKWGVKEFSECFAGPIDLRKKTDAAKVQRFLATLEPTVPA